VHKERNVNTQCGININDLLPILATNAFAFWQHNAVLWEWNLWVFVVCRHEIRVWASVRHRSLGKAGPCKPSS